jgi:signal transduction histidine kinase
LHKLARNPLAPGVQASGSLRRAQQAVDDIDGVLEHCREADRLSPARWRKAPAVVDLTLAVLEQLDRHPARGRARLDLPAEPLWVRADAATLAIVLRNLLDNALHYSPADRRSTSRCFAAMRPVRPGRLCASATRC